MSDEVISCTDCRIDFVFSANEADFYASKGLSKPRRCKLCRQKRRDARTTTHAASVPVSSGWVGGGETETAKRSKGKSREPRRRNRYDEPEY